MTSTAVPAWTPITTFNVGFTPGTFGFIPAYRAWPDGKVEWRGIVQGTMTADDTSIIGLPPEVKPAAGINMVTATSLPGDSEGHMRVEFSPLSKPNDLVVYPQGKDRTWLSLDGLYYYVD